MFIHEAVDPKAKILYTGYMTTGLQYKIEIDGIWEDTTHEVFRSWSGRRKLNGQEYYGPVFEFLTENIAIAGKDAYQKHLNEISDNGFNSAADFIKSIL
jgi:hypothetical protein